MAKTVILKALGTTVGYLHLLNRVRSLWGIPDQNFSIMDLGHGFFLAKFKKKRDYNYVLQEGPYTVAGHYLVVKKWSQDFRPSLERISSTLVWVRLPELPIEYYNAMFFTRVGNKLGTTIKIDKNTLEAKRGCYARICVEISLDKPLIPHVRIGGRLQ